MANKLIKHLLGYGVEGNAGYITAKEVDLTAIGSTAVVGVCTDYSGNIYLSDPTEHIIIKVTESGVVRLFAGQAGVPGMTNGISTVALFNGPAGIDCDRSGFIYVADSGNNQIRRIDQNGNVSLLAGSAAGTAGVDNGANLASRFNKPSDVSVDSSGNVYVADTNNNKIRIIRGANTFDVAGDHDGAAGDVLGQGNAARFNGPYSVSCDRAGRIFVADSVNQKIKFITNNFTVHLLVGPAFLGGTFNSLKYLAVDNSCYIYVVDYDDVQAKSRLLRVDQEGNGGVVVDFDVKNLGVAVSPNQTLYVTESDDVDFDSSSSLSSVSDLSSESESSGLLPPP